MMALPAITIAPVRASALPLSVAPVLKVIDCMARIVPLKTEVVPNVADVPTCQKILAADAPLVRNTLRPAVVVNVDAIWMMKTEFTFPFPSKVTSPEETASDDVDLYRPGVKVIPPMFPDKVTISVAVLPAASLYAAVRSSLAWVAIASLICCVPTRIPGGKPPIDVPGLKPISPVICVAPVLLIAEPARMASVAFAPIATGACEVDCSGTVCALAEGFEGCGSLLSFLQPTIKMIDTSAKAVIMFLRFIFLFLRLRCWRTVVINFTLQSCVDSILCVLHNFANKLQDSQVGYVIKACIS